MDKQRVVIVGGGFGGVRLALKLSKHKSFDIKLISDKPYFEYHAALYRSATGRSPLEVAIPLEEFFSRHKNIEVIHDKITGFDTDKKQVRDGSGSSWRYDSLVIATGNEANYFGIKGLEKYSHNIKSVQQALAFKRHIHKCIDSDHFVVIGAGPSGVELAGELPGYINGVRKKHGLPTDGFKVELIEAKDKILPTLPRKFTSKATKRLEKLGIEILLSSKVQGETADSLKVDGRDIKARVVAWTAGTKPNPLLKDPAIHKSRRGLAEVDNTLGATSGVYVIGDAADTKYSGMAQTAIYDANQLAGNLIRQAKGKKPKEYRPHRPVYAIPVGPRWSAVLWGDKKIYGFGGWVIRRLADFKLYLTLLTPAKAMSAWRYGLKRDEICDVCRSKI